MPAQFGSVSITGWLVDCADPNARERALEIAWQDLPANISPRRAITDVERSNPEQVPRRVIQGRLPTEAASARAMYRNAPTRKAHQTNQSARYRVSWRVLADIIRRELQPDHQPQEPTRWALASVSTTD